MSTTDCTSCGHPIERHTAGVDLRSGWHSDFFCSDCECHDLRINTAPAQPPASLDVAASMRATASVMRSPALKADVLALCDEVERLTLENKLLTAARRECLARIDARDGLIESYRKALEYARYCSTEDDVVQVTAAALAADDGTHGGGDGA